MFFMLEKIFPYCKEPQVWEKIFDELLPQYEITTRQRKAAFLAQCGHESSSFNVLKENLNYSADALLRVFPRYFTVAKAQQVARNQKLIGDIVYGNRMGNGPDEGYLYRGRGLIQVTGKDNYRECSKYMYNDERLLETPDLLLDKEKACLSAIWYWKKHHLNTFADADDILTMTRKINGGVNGLDERKRYYKKALEMLG